MFTFSTNNTFTGLSFHLDQALIGAALTAAILLPLLAYYALRSRRNSDKSILGSKHEAHSEKVKSDIILASIDDGVVVINLDKTISVFNKGATQITGWPAHEAETLVYKSVMKLLDSKGVEYTDSNDPFQKVFTTETTYRDNDAMLVTKAGGQIPIHLNVYPLLDTDKNSTATGVVGIFRDVTQERAREIQRNEFISTASHEMRTPVAAIEGYIALALNDKVSLIDTKARDYLEKARTSTRHLGKLFQNLLTSSKAEDGLLTQTLQAVEVSSFLSKAINTLKISAEKKGLIVDFFIGNDESHEVGGEHKVISPLYYVLIDKDRLLEVVTNLFENAVHYTDTGKITIGLTGDSKIIQFYVKDTGIGIAPEDTAHLFQRFYRIDNSATRNIGGTGLGLYISRKIIELNKGRIWIESSLDMGSTFYVNLPRLDSKKATILLSQYEKPKINDI